MSSQLDLGVRRVLSMYDEQFCSPPTPSPLFVLLLPVAILSVDPQLRAGVVIS